MRVSTITLLLLITINVFVDVAYGCARYRAFTLSGQVGYQNVVRSTCHGEGPVGAISGHTFVHLVSADTECDTWMYGIVFGKRTFASKIESNNEAVQIEFFDAP